MLSKPQLNNNSTQPQSNITLVGLDPTPPSMYYVLSEGFQQYYYVEWYVVRLYDKYISQIFAKLSQAPAPALLAGLVSLNFT